jgi:arginine N-succinyltransferase
VVELNSRGRLLFVASHPERFADSVVTEIVGYSDENGDSPFWDAIGRNFFDLNYADAERLCGLKSRTFLAELMPHYPIYVPLLPDAAQKAMGQVHPRAQITFDILMREGFETDHYIDIFDGGPTLHARVSGIRSIAQSRVVPVKIGEPVKGAVASTWWPTASCRITARCCWSWTTRRASRSPWIWKQPKPWASAKAPACAWWRFKAEFYAGGERAARLRR